MPRGKPELETSSCARTVIRFIHRCSLLRGMPLRTDNRNSFSASFATSRSLWNSTLKIMSISILERIHTNATFQAVAELLSRLGRCPSTGKSTLLRNKRRKQKEARQKISLTPGNMWLLRLPTREAAIEIHLRMETQATIQQVHLIKLKNVHRLRRSPSL